MSNLPIYRLTSDGIYLFSGTSNGLNGPMILPFFIPQYFPALIFLTKRVNVNLRMGNYGHITMLRKVRYTTDLVNQL